MEIKKVKNIILDKLNVERVMTEDEVKEELSLIRSKRVAVGLTIGCGALAIAKYSSLVDDIVFSFVNTVKEYMVSTTTSMGGLAIPNWFMCVIYISITLLGYSYYIENLNKAKNSK